MLREMFKLFNLFHGITNINCVPCQAISHKYFLIKAQPQFRLEEDSSDLIPLPHTCTIPLTSQYYIWYLNTAYLVTLSSYLHHANRKFEHNANFMRSHHASRLKQLQGVQNFLKQMSLIVCGLYVCKN